MTRESLWLLLSAVWVVVLIAAEIYVAFGWKADRRPVPVKSRSRPFDVDQGLKPLVSLTLGPMKRGTIPIAISLMWVGIVASVLLLVVFKY